MLIKPFKPLSDDVSLTTKRSCKIDIHYVPKYNTFLKSEVIIVHKYLIKNFVDSGRTAYVKIVSTYTTDFRSTDIKSDINSVKSIPIKLKNAIVSVYDGFNNFGHTVYVVDEYDVATVMCVSSHSNGSFVYSMNQNYGINNLEAVKYQRMNTIFPFIEENEDGTYEIDKAYSGCDDLYDSVNLIVDSDLKKYLAFDANIIEYNSKLQENLSMFSDTNLTNISKNIYLKGCANVPPNEIILRGAINEALCKMDFIRKLIGIMNKSFIESMFDSITFIYRNGKLTVHNIEYPFNVRIPEHIMSRLNNFSENLEKDTLKIQDMFGLVTIIVKITEAYTYVSCKFEDETAYCDYENPSYWSNMVGSNIVKDFLYRTEINNRYFYSSLRYIPDVVNNGDYPVNYTSEFRRIYDLLDYFNDIPF